jgi:hypothetical protein
MSRSIRKAGGAVELGWYFVAFVDLLGQREHLRQLTGLPKVIAPTDPMVVALKRSWGAVHLIRMLFVDFFQELSKGGALSRSLPPPQRQALLRMTKTNVLYDSFSDSIVVAVPLKAPPGDPTPANGVWAALLAVASTATLALAAKHPLRAGIDVGVAARVSEHEIYGAALERAYTLESRIAQHPRLAVGDELIAYLQHVSDLPPDNVGNRIASMQAGIARSFIFKDNDGQAALDYLGAAVKGALAGGFQPSRVQVAYDFVVAQEAKWVAQGNTTLVDRYRAVRSYFASRADIWGLRVDLE